MLRTILAIFQANDCQSILDACSQTSIRKSVARRVFCRFEPEQHDVILNLLVTHRDARLLHDPIEDLYEFRRVIANAQHDAEEELGNRKRGRGFCHLLWRTKKRILLDEYGIEWLSPSDMNPMVKFD